MNQHRFYSSTTKWSSSPNDSAIHGQTNIVEIDNGKGYKVKETLNESGDILTSVKKRLQKDEIHSIMNGQFVPGLWRDCSKKNLGSRVRSRPSLRNSRRTRRSKKISK